jgi:hypothetical protein
MKQDITTARKIAEAHLDEMMHLLNPSVGFTFSGNTAYLADLQKQRLILDREPNESEKAALLAYAVELQLRTGDGFEFEWDGQLYIHEPEKGYQRYTLDRQARKWNAEQLPLLDFIQISNFVEKHTVSEADRAAAARADMERLEAGPMKKPTGLKEV